MVKKVQIPEGTEVLFGMVARITIQLELKKRDLSYRDLTRMLNEQFGIKENERNIRNKIARGTFSAAFFLMCMKVLDARTLDYALGDLRLADQFDESQGPSGKS
jgi:hypothetical protein